jgi:8-oxo-dGTP diphosphatase
MLPQLVVGAAVVRNRRVLAARRTAPTSTAGRWEFPGGKVDPGESPEQALVREVEEELGVAVRLERWLDGAQPIGPYVLRVALCALERGEPAPTEHDQVRWLGADELDDVDWLDGDRPFLTELSAHLTTLEP